MAKIVMMAQGLDGNVILMTDRVVIDRPGIWNFFKYGNAAKREIPFAAISEIIFKEPTVFTMGEIEFVRSGRSSDDRKTKNKANHVRFRKKSGAQFEKLKEKTFDMMNQQQQQRR